MECPYFFILPLFRGYGRNPCKNFFGFLGDLKTPKGPLGVTNSLPGLDLYDAFDFALTQIDHKPWQNDAKILAL